MQAGQQLAQQGSGAAQACVSCHGAQGEGNAQAGFPRLAGQGGLYLVHQLDSYASGSRKNPVMQPIAAALSEAQRRQLAAYYAGLGQPPATANAGGAAPRDPVLAARGDDKRQLQGCVNCHGPQGIGDAAATPYLAGQHASYLTAALNAWKSGDRNNDPSGQMPRIAKTLTDDEARALVAYYAGLPPPAPRNAQIAAAALPGGRRSCNRDHRRRPRRSRARAPSRAHSPVAPRARARAARPPTRGRRRARPVARRPRHGGLERVAGERQALRPSVLAGPPRSPVPQLAPVAVLPRFRALRTSSNDGPARTGSNAAHHQETPCADSSVPCRPC